MPDYPKYEKVNEFEKENNLSILDYFTVILDEWRILMTPFVLVVLGSLAYLAVVVPTYESSGVIQVSSSDTTDAEAILNLVGETRSEVDTEIEILRSRRIIGQAVRDLSLNVIQPASNYTLDFSVSLKGASPVNPDLRELRRAMKNVVAADWVQSKIPAVIFASPSQGLDIQIGKHKTLYHVAPGDTLNNRTVSFVYNSNSNFKPSSKIDVFFLPDSMAIKRIQSGLGVSGIGGGRKDTNLVRVSFEHSDRVIARDFVNAVMNAYMEFSLEWKTLRANRSTAFIKRQLEALKEELDKTEGELQQFTQQNGAVLLDDQAKELIKNGADLGMEMRKIKIQEEMLAIVSGSMGRLMRRGETTALSADFFTEDELLAKAIGTINELELKKELLLADVTPAHPEVVKLGDQIKRAQEQAHKLILASRERVRQRKEAVSTELDGIQMKLSGFPDKARRLAVVQRNLGASQNMYAFLLSKLEETQIIKASTTTDKKIIDNAAMPFTHSTPDRKTNMLISLVIGLLLGVGAVFAKRAIDPRVSDEEEAKALSGLPTYGVIPDLHILGLLKEEQSPLKAIWETPKGSAAESFRTIRTNVEFAQVEGEKLRVIQITSSQASEGKSTVISNLAVALARAGHRIIIVDLDLRRPILHKNFETSRIPGISDHIVGQADLKIHHIKEYDIDFISAGNEPPETQRLLSSKRIADLINKWRNEYDYVLLDTPPLLVADSLVISKMSDLVLFVIRPKHCRRDQLKLAKNTHDRMDLVKGLIINGVTTRRGGYYHYYRGYYYGSKTSDTQES